MGRAYGLPIPGTIDGPMLQTAERQALAGFSTEPPDVLWRIEAVRYSTCTILEHGGEDYGTTDPRLELFALPVHRWTPCGATLVEYSGARRRWVNLQPHAKQYASRTPAEALEQFKARRRAQIWILERQIANARRELALAEPPRGGLVGPRAADPSLLLRPY